MYIYTFEIGSISNASQREIYLLNRSHICIGLGAVDVDADTLLSASWHFLRLGKA